MINDDAASPRIITLSSQISALAHSVPVPTASFCAIDFFFSLFFLFFFLYYEGSKRKDNVRHRESVDFPLYELFTLGGMNTLVRNSRLIFGSANQSARFVSSVFFVRKNAIKALLRTKEMYKKGFSLTSIWNEIVEYCVLLFIVSRINDTSIWTNEISSVCE